jgi:hypothetical protein
MRLLIAAALLTQLMFAGPASACHLERPHAAVILSIEGQIGNCNAGFEVQFDLAMLESLPKRVVRTQNPWEERVAIYEGVLLRDLVEIVKANGTVLRIAALNDYSADIDVADTESIDVILAFKRNGKYMPVRERGPLLVVFPFSDEPDLKVQQRFIQSVWQVSRITVK